MGYSDMGSLDLHREQGLALEPEISKFFFTKIVMRAK